MTRAAALLVVLGLAQMAGDLAGFAPLRGAAAATAASPAPKVFSAVQGLETYSSRFAIEWTDVAGAAHVLELVPERYAAIRGPYNRRNVYGAVLAYAPVLSSDPRTRDAFEGIATYALCGDAPLLRELGVDPSKVRGPRRVRIEPRAGFAPAGLPLSFELGCS
jgi:hypothetical protein